MYWAAETRYANIADVMSNKRYKQLRKENPAKKKRYDVQNTSHFGGSQSLLHKN